MGRPSAITASGARSGAVISRSDPSERDTSRAASASERSDARSEASTHAVDANDAPGVISRSSHALAAEAVPPPGALGTRAMIGLPAATASSRDEPNPGSALSGTTSESA